MSTAKKIHELRVLSGTTVSEVDAKAIPSHRVGALSSAIEPYAACMGRGDVGASYRRPKELGEVVATGDEIATVEGIVLASNSIGMRMRTEWLLRVWTTEPHTRATAEARDVRMASYVDVGAQYE